MDPNLLIGPSSRCARQLSACLVSPQDARPSTTSRPSKILSPIHTPSLERQSVARPSRPFPACLASFTAVINAWIAGSPSVTSTVLFNPRASRHLMVISTGAWLVCPEPWLPLPLSTPRACLHLSLAGSILNHRLALATQVELDELAASCACSSPGSCATTGSYGQPFQLSTGTHWGVTTWHPPTRFGDHSCTYCLEERFSRHDRCGDGRNYEPETKVSVLVPSSFWNP